MKGQIDTQYGKVLVEDDVIATYAGSVAVECFGIVGMAAVNMKDGLVKLLKRDYLTHGISVTIEDENLINIDFHVIVAYGVSSYEAKRGNDSYRCKGCGRQSA